MSWISENIDGILEIIRPLWNDFLNNGGYDGVKYPEEVYKSLLSPDKIDDKWIRESLIWKYGKWKQYVNGKNAKEKKIKEFFENKLPQFRVIPPRVNGVNESNLY